jgi:glycosyltransferase involved in cell wall biosynthesis
MIERGWRVRVLTSARGYDDPDRRHPKRETIDGVEVRRFGLSSFGKRLIALRVMGALGFLFQAFVYGLFVRHVDCLLISTSPPMCPAAGLALSVIRRVPMKFWAMDINPDQLIATGNVRSNSLLVRLMEWLNRRTLRGSSAVVTLDRYMADRLASKVSDPPSIHVIPPWPHVDGVAQNISHSENHFRKRHGLDGKFVVMYSGNMSPVHPLDTLLEAARQLEGEGDFVFLFIGGGLGAEVVRAFKEKHSLANIRLLPYQPFSELPYSLSAADVHVVTLGDAMVGVVHPCKIYGALAVGRPILAIGPRPSHVSDILDAHSVGWVVAHGDVAGAVRALCEARDMSASALAARGRAAQDTVAKGFGRAILRGRLCDVLEAPARA